MAETAAHIQENIIGQFPIRQWVVSFLKRIRYYLQTDAILQKVLRIVTNEIRKKVIACSPGATNAEFGAISLFNALEIPSIFILISTSLLQMAYLKKKDLSTLTPSNLLIK